MILVCLECATDMQEIKRNVFRCPCCGWGAEQLTIEGMSGMEEDRKNDLRDMLTELASRFMDDGESIEGFVERMLIILEQNYPAELSR